MPYFVSRFRPRSGLGQRELVGWPASMHGFAEPPPPFDIIGGFAFDRADLGPPQHTKILALARHIAARGIRSVQLIGHTDAVGTPGYNQGLGQRRAEAVRGALLATLDRMRPGSAASVSVTVTSVGATQPGAGGAGAAQRRVEVLLLPPPPPPPPPPPVRVAPPPPPPPPPPLPPPRPYTGPTMGPAPRNMPPPPPCPPNYICGATRALLQDRARRNGTGMVTQRDVQDALDLEHRLLMQNRRRPLVVDPHQAEEYHRWVGEMRQEACRRLNEFARREFMPFPRC